MRLKSVMAVCKDAKNIRLYDVLDGEGCVHQWLGNGIACYPIDNLPYMGLDNILNLFDLSGKALEKWSYRHCDAEETDGIGIDFSDPKNEDEILKPFDLTVNFGGRCLVALRAVDGRVIFIGEELLKPIIHVIDDTSFHERRRPDGTSYVIASTGFLISAVLMPSMKWKNEYFVEQLDDLCRVVCRTRELEGESWKREDD